MALGFLTAHQLESPKLDPEKRSFQLLSKIAFKKILKVSVILTASVLLLSTSIELIASKVFLVFSLSLVGSLTYFFAHRNLENLYREEEKLTKRTLYYSTLLVYIVSAMTVTVFTSFGLAFTVPKKLIPLISSVSVLTYQAGIFQKLKAQ